MVVVINESSAAIGGRRRFGSHPLGSRFMLKNKKTGVLLYISKLQFRVKKFVQGIFRIFWG